jgi:hypothetical protein
MHWRQLKTARGGLGLTCRSLQQGPDFRYRVFAHIESSESTDAEYDFQRVCSWTAGTQT